MKKSKYRVVKQYDCLGGPEWVIEYKGLFGWHNIYPAHDGWPEKTYASEEEAIAHLKKIILGESLKGKREVVFQHN